jgi:hypothetical protein
LVDFVAAVTLNASVGDPDGDIAAIEWYSSDEGYLGAGATLDVALSTMGTDVAQPLITVRVIDSFGNMTEQQIQLIVRIPSDE